MRHLLAILITFAIGISSYADDYKYLTFVKANGLKENITAVGTVITFNDGILNAVNGSENLTMTLTDLTKMYFSQKASVLMGDVNDDGELSVIDVTLLVDYILGNIQTDEEKIALVEERGDLSLNGEISIEDISILVELILNN